MTLSARPTGIDLVDFGEVRMFMFRDDNLYTINVPPERRNYSVLQHYQDVSRHGYPKSTMTLESAPINDDSRYAFQALISHLHHHGISLHLLDVGGFIGDFSLLLANFARSWNIPFRADVFDPSPAGTLIPYNIEINGLQEFVTFHDLAVSGVDGPLKFSHTIAHLDSASVQTGAPRDVDYLVRSTRISTFIRAHDVAEHGLLVKIDTEGLESTIIHDLLDAVTVRPIIVTEFTPNTFGATVAGDHRDLEELATHYCIYDVSHLPYPSRVRVVPENQLDEYTEMIRRRDSRYADLLLLPKDLPGLEDLKAQFARTEKGQRGLYNLVGTARTGRD